MNAIATQPPTAIPLRRERTGGRRGISIRPIERADGSGLSDFYAALSPESRRRRFLGSCGTLPARLVPGLVDQGDAGLVAVLSEPGPDDGLIVGHASLQPDGVGGAEIAFAVADGLQGRGIGHRLVAGVLARARSLGLRHVTAVLFADNVRMRRLLREAGPPILADDLDAGVEEITLAVGPAS
jgi:GNAT superfamily N-acetyltransferase